MVSKVAALMAVVVLGSPFGEAAVEGTPVGDRLQVEFEVAVAGDPVAVAVHAVDPGQTQETISLGNRGGGVWAGLTDLDVMNYVIVFEVIYADGEGSVSGPTTLLELGLDPALIGMGEGVDVEADDGSQPLSPTTRRWGWGAVALTAVALALLAVWAMGDRVAGKHRGKHRGGRRSARRAAEEAAEEAAQEAAENAVEEAAEET